MPSSHIGVKIRLAHNGIHLRKEISSRTSSCHQLPMPDDGVAVNRQPVVGAEVGQQHCCRFDLLRGRLADLEVSTDVDANCVTVMPVRMRTDRPVRSALQCRPYG